MSFDFRLWAALSRFVCLVNILELQTLGTGNLSNRVR